jgi:HNH endonuclease
MKQIVLTQGKVALVDDEDFAWLSRWKWYAAKHIHTYYAERRNGEGKMRMHVAILKDQLGDTGVVDHRDGDGLNNQRNNLRVTTHRGNMQNRKCHRGGKLVGTQLHNKRWRSRIVLNGKRIIVGTFNTEQEAYDAYIEFLHKNNLTLIGS